MNFHNEIDSDFLAMVELTTEISSIVQNLIDQYRDELNPEEIEHIIKITSDVVLKLKRQSLQITV